MGYSACTTYVRATGAAIESAIETLFNAAGMRRCEPPHEPPERWDPLRYGSAATSKRWHVRIERGSRWSAIETEPPRLLAEGELLIAALARALETDAFMLAIEDGIAMVVLEADRSGSHAVSGFTGGGLVFSGRAIAEDRAEARFDLVDVPDEIHAALGSRREECHAIIDATLVGESSSAELWFERATVAPIAKDALELALDRATDGRLRLTCDGGEIWIDDHAIEAPDAIRGSVMLERFARWLDVPCPTAAPGVPLPVFALLAPTARGDRLTIGERDPVSLVLELSANRARITEDDTTLREELVTKLTRALRGWRVEGAMFDRFVRAGDRPTQTSHGAFVGEAAVVAQWTPESTLVWVARERSFETLCELEGVVTAIAGSDREAWLVLVEPTRFAGNSRGYGQTNRARLVRLDVATGASTTVLESEPSLTFGFARLACSGDEVAIAVERGRRAYHTLVLDRAGRLVRELEGTLAAWDALGIVLEQRGAIDRPLHRITDDGARVPATTFLCPDETIAVTFSGDVATSMHAGTERRIAAPLFANHRAPVTWIGATWLACGPDRAVDCTTGRERPLFVAGGLALGAVSPSGARVLAACGASMWLAE